MGFSKLSERFLLCFCKTQNASVLFWCILICRGSKACWVGASDESVTKQTALLEGDFIEIQSSFHHVQYKEQQRVGSNVACKACCVNPT